MKQFYGMFKARLHQDNCKDNYTDNISGAHTLIVHAESSAALNARVL